MRINVDPQRSDHFVRAEHFGGEENVVETHAAFNFVVLLMGRADQHRVAFQVRVTFDLVSAGRIGKVKCCLVG